jgi:hypothetical protein
VISQPLNWLTLCWTTGIRFPVWHFSKSPRPNPLSLFSSGYQSLFPERWSPKFTTDLQGEPRLRTRGALHSRPLYPFPGIVLRQMDNFIYSLISYSMSRNSSVVIETGYGPNDWMIEVRFPGGWKFFSSTQCRDRLWGPPSLLSHGYLRLFPWV